MSRSALQPFAGGVSVNYHALNDFRAGNEALMHELLTDNVAALAAMGAISLDRVAQDGMRVRADAGAACCECQCAAWSRSDLWWACSCWRTTCCVRPCSRRNSLVGCCAPKVIEME
ncbi:hypothetical protein B0E49_11555 [Polaromonas sp. C04]|nr:hypothetical protein B0E49_11555 [Polaromonas sp. C04]